MRPNRRQPTRLPRPWDSPGKNTRVGCHFLLQGFFLIKELSLGLLHCRQILYWLSCEGSPIYALEYDIYLSLSDLFHSFLGSFPGGSDGKEFACNVGDLGSSPMLGRTPGEGNGNPLQYSCVENPHGQRSLGATVHGVTKSQTWLRDWVQHSTCILHCICN